MNVTDSSSAPASGVTVNLRLQRTSGASDEATIADASATSYKQDTNADGVAVFENIPVGRYLLYSTNDNGIVSQSVNLTKAEHTQALKLK